MGFFFYYIAKLLSLIKLDVTISIIISEREVFVMAVSYNKLWKLLIDKNMKKMQLKEAAGIGSTTLSKLSKNRPVSMEVMMKLCEVLECNIGDIMDIIEKE